MRFRLTTAVAALATVATAGGVVLLGTGVANAVTPGWEPDPNSIGAIWLYDATGNLQTSGSQTDSPIAAYAFGAQPGHATGDTKATLFLCTPQQGVNPANWTCDQLSSSTDYPNASAPGGLATTTHPVVTGASGDETVAQYASLFPNNLTDPNYQNLYELRVYTSGAGQSQGGTYDSADIQVNPTGGTWTQVSPTPTATTTALTADKTSPQPGGTSLTLTATLTASAPGTVQFFDGATQVGTTQTLPGTATNNKVSVSDTPGAGTHPYKAVYTPAVGSGFAGSQGTLSFQIQGPAVNTSTALAETDDGHAFDPVTFTATVTADDSAHPGGSVSFADGSTNLGNGTETPAGSGVFKLTTSSLGAGTHSVTATFTPSVSGYNGSTSQPVDFSLGAADCTTCRNEANIKATIPAGTLTITTPYTSESPLDLGTMALTSDNREFQATAQFGSSTDPTQAIYITDTRGGSLSWTASALAGALTDGGTNPGSTINGENVGLTNLTVVPVTGNAFDGTAANLTTFANPAADPAVAPSDTGALGLGGGAPHQFAHATHGAGAVGFTGTLTLNAPTSTEPGTFTGTVTFTIA